MNSKDAIILYKVIEDNSNNKNLSNSSIDAEEIYRRNMNRKLQI